MVRIFRGSEQHFGLTGWWVMAVQSGARRVAHMDIKGNLPVPTVLKETIVAISTDQPKQRAESTLLILPYGIIIFQLGQ